MRGHGIDMPDPRPGRGLAIDGDVNPERFEGAQRACQEELGEPPGAELSDEEQREFREAALKYARCMRARGHRRPGPEDRRRRQEPDWEPGARAQRPGLLRGGRNMPRQGARLARGPALAARWWRSEGLAVSAMTTGRRPARSLRPPPPGPAHHSRGHRSAPDAGAGRYGRSEAATRAAVDHRSHAADPAPHPSGRARRPTGTLITVGEITTRCPSGLPGPAR
jgi:hypothetical protein